MSDQNPKNLKILFVEDEDIIRKRTVSSFKYIVGEVLEASNGLEALEKLKNFTPDIVITDLEMPSMNGIELIRKIREKTFKNHSGNSKNRRWKKYYLALVKRR